MYVNVCIIVCVCMCKYVMHICECVYLYVYISIALYEFCWKSKQIGIYVSIYISRTYVKLETILYAIMVYNYMEISS